MCDRTSLRAILAIVACALPCTMCNAAPHSALVELERELRGSGANYDDPCFWQDPIDPERAFGCVTSKGKKQVECFDLATGRLAGVARGFLGEPNNCDIDPVRNEMATTDNAAQVVRVHSLPSFHLLRSLPVAGAGDLGGICVAREKERSVLFVTDEKTGRVIALDSADGGIVREWRHGLAEVEGIACDNEWQRVIVCDDKSAEDGCQAFGYDGQPGPGFGSEVLGADAEGVTIYRCPRRQGYVIVSDQRHNEFEVFRRHDFEHVCTFAMKKGTDLTSDTDGIDILQSRAYPEGLFGACDDCSSAGRDELHVARWAAIAAACELRICPVSAPDR